MRADRLLGAALAMGLGTAAQAAGPRIVSLNLCTDQLLLALADPDQILGLSPYARDAARSAVAAASRPYPVLSGSAEEVLVIRPDLVLAGRFTKLATRQILRANGMRVVEFDAATSIEQVRAQIRQAGGLTGHPDRAEAGIAAIDSAVERARAAASRHALTVLPLQRRGWVSGGNTLMGSLLAVVGLRNAGSELNRGGGFVSLEAVVRLRPDLLLVSRSELEAEDQGSALLHHPALAALYPPEKRLTLPEQMTVCGGPEIGPALDRLAEEITARAP